MSQNKTRHNSRLFFMVLTRVFLLLALSGVADLAHAQDQDKASIVGTVTDSANALIQNATITIKNVNTDITSVLHTDDQGLYTSPPLQIGTYLVTAEKKGFGTIVESDVVLDVGTRVEVNFTMMPGPVTAEITVQSNSPALNTTSGTIGYTIDQRTIEQMPLNGGNVLALTALLPGVVNVFGATTPGFNERGVQLSSIRVGGGAVGAYSITLDGASNQITYLGEVAINPQADAIAQFRLFNGSTPAQFGFTSGGSIEMASRAGGNKIHGTIYEFFRNDALDAQGYFASQDIHKPELRYNRFGGSIGGPFIHDKFFFFGNAERYELIQTSPAYTTVPTPLERMGDFSQTHISGSGCLNVSIDNPVSGAQFAGAKIPSNYIDQTALELQNAYYPLPNNSSGPYNSDLCSLQNNYVGNARVLSHQQTVMGRLDYQANPHNGFFLRYGLYSIYTNNNNLFPDPVAGARYDTPTNQISTFGWTRVLNANTVNDLRISGLRAKFGFRAGSHDMNLGAKFGISNIPPDTLPLIQNGEAQFQTTDGYRSATQFQISDLLSKQIGPHSVVAGVDLRFNQAENAQNNAPSGIFTFTALQTANSASCPTCTGSVYASYLLGDVASAQFYAESPATFRSSSVSGFLQDDWRATRDLTLNIGLRYDYQQQPFEIRGRTSNFDITRGDPVNGYFGETVYSNTGGWGKTFNRENYTDFSPRFGFAWTVPHTNQLIFRGGYSVYYSSTANISFGGSTNGFAQTVTSYTAASNNGVALILEDGFPYAPNQNIGAAGGPAALIGTGSVFYQEPNQRTPMSQVWNLTFSKQLPGHFVVDATYLANNGMHFVEPSYNLNEPSQAALSAFTGTWPDPIQAQVPNPYAGKIPGIYGTPTISQYNLDRPYPYYTGVSDFMPHNGRYFGNFMYLSVQRRVATGVEIISAYTFGKLLSDPIYVPLSTSGGGINTGGVGSFQNPHDRSPEHTIDTLDITHRLSISVIGHLPFGVKNHWLSNSGWERAVFGNINLNTIIVAQSGFPLNISGANNYGIATRPSFTGVSPHSNCSNGVRYHTVNCWFNTAAFQNPRDYAFGNVPRVLSNLRGPGALNVDASIIKDIRLSNHWKSQFRVEAFNIFNHTNLNNPNLVFAALLNAGQAGYGPANTSGTFGAITSAQPARVIQLGVKFNF